MSSRSNNQKPELKGERVQKALARTGVASRREIDRLLQAGRIVIDGRPARPGDRLQGPERVLIDGRPVRFTAESNERACEVLAYHKPTGQITTQDDPQARPTVFDDLPQAPAGRWIVVGRLDLNTSGLLLFTTDGELAHRLMHPSYEIDREYAVRIRGELSGEQMESLLSGVELEDGVARFQSVAEMEHGKSNSWYQVQLQEGRNREVRRMFEAVGATVSRLIRTRYGPIALGRMRRGETRLLDKREINALRRATNLDDSARR